MRQTQNLLLKLPEPTDFVQVEDLNENFTKIDTEIAKITDEETGVAAELTKHLDEKASLTTSGHTKLSNAIDSTSDTLSATPSAVKQAFDRGDSAFNNEVELRAEFNSFKAALTEGFTDNQFSDGLTSLNAFNVTAGFYNLSLTRLEV